MLLLAAGVSAYFCWWRVSHYVKEAKTVVVDLRRRITGSFQEKATDSTPTNNLNNLKVASNPQTQLPRDATHYVAFCSRFSENPVGFPGHGFVLWSQQWPPPQLRLCDTSGRYPCEAFDQFVALVTPVNGTFVKEPLSSHPECVEYSLVAVVDAEDFERSLQVRDQWRHRKFKVFESDCVNFVDAIAATLALERPARATLFPQDYVGHLRELNAGKSVRDLNTGKTLPDLNTGKAMRDLNTRTGIPSHSTPIN